jgi:hypothetical protein
MMTRAEFNDAAVVCQKESGRDGSAFVQKYLVQTGSTKGSDLPNFKRSEGYASVRQKMLNAGWKPFHAKVPRAQGSTWGADLPGAPPMLNPQFQDSPEALSVIMVPVTYWSEGTSAPKMQ